MSTPNSLFPRARFRLLPAVAAACALLLSGFLPQAAQAATTLTLWGGRTPTLASVAAETRSVELGTRFTPTVAGKATGVRFWKTPENAGTHTGTLWTSGGTKLATTTFTGESGKGWQQATFSTPVDLKAGRTYVVSYHVPRGRYISTQNFSGTSSNTELSVSRGSGVYRYGSGGFPTQTWNNSQYWVDVAFVTGASSQPGTSTEPTPDPTTPPTTTPTTGDRPLDCKAVPSACGYPDATNTGPAAGTQFVRVPQDVRSGNGWAWNDYLRGVRVTGAGAVLNGLDVSGQIIIDAPDVTVSNSKVAKCGGSWEPDVIAVRYRESDPSYRGANARIIHNDLNGTPAGCTYRARSGVRDIYGEAPSIHIDGNNIHGSANGITAEYSALVVNNWVHDLGYLPGDHLSGISTHGGASSVVIRHNTVLLYGLQNLPGGGGVSGALTNYADFGHSQNVTLQDNFISGGSYTVYGGNSGDSYRTPATNIKVISNRFVCGDWLYGPVMAFSPSSTGNEWTDNYCDQDAAVVRA